MQVDFEKKVFSPIVTPIDQVLTGLPSSIPSTSTNSDQDLKSQPYLSKENLASRIFIELNSLAINFGIEISETISLKKFINKLAELISAFIVLEAKEINPKQKQELEKLAENLLYTNDFLESNFGENESEVLALAALNQIHKILASAIEPNILSKIKSLNQLYPNSSQLKKAAKERKQEIEELGKSQIKASEKLKNSLVGEIYKDANRGNDLYIYGMLDHQLNEVKTNLEFISLPILKGAKKADQIDIHVPPNVIEFIGNTLPSPLGYKVIAAEIKSPKGTQALSAQIDSLGLVTINVPIIQDSEIRYRLSPETDPAKLPKLKAHKSQCISEFSKNMRALIHKEKDIQKKFQLLGAWMQASNLVYSNNIAILKILDKAADKGIFHELMHAMGIGNCSHFAPFIANEIKQTLGLNARTINGLTIAEDPRDYKIKFQYPIGHAKVLVEDTEGKQTTIEATSLANSTLSVDDEQIKEDAPKVLEMIKAYKEGDDLQSLCTELSNYAKRWKIPKTNSEQLKQASNDFINSKSQLDTLLKPSSILSSTETNIPEPRNDFSLNKALKYIKEFPQLINLKLKTKDYDRELENLALSLMTIFNKGSSFNDLAEYRNLYPELIAAQEHLEDIKNILAKESELTQKFIEIIIKNKTYEDLKHNPRLAYLLPQELQAQYLQENYLRPECDHNPQSKEIHLKEIQLRLKQKQHPHLSDSHGMCHPFELALEEFNFLEQLNFKEIVHALDMLFLFQKDIKALWIDSGWPYTFLENFPNPQDPLKDQKMLAAFYTCKANQKLHFIGFKNNSYILNPSFLVRCKDKFSSAEELKNWQNILQIKFGETNPIASTTQVRSFLQERMTCTNSDPAVFGTNNQDGYDGFLKHHYKDNADIIEARDKLLESILIGQGKYNLDDFDTEIELDRMDNEFRTYLRRVLLSSAEILDYYKQKLGFKKSEINDIPITQKRKCVIAFIDGVLEKYPETKKILEDEIEQLSSLEISLESTADKRLGNWINTKGPLADSLKNLLSTHLNEQSSLRDVWHTALGSQKPRAIELLEDCYQIINNDIMPTLRMMFSFNEIKMLESLQKYATLLVSDRMSDTSSKTGVDDEDLVDSDIINFLLGRLDLFQPQYSGDILYKIFHSPNKSFLHEPLLRKILDNNFNLNQIADYGQLSSCAANIKEFANSLRNYSERAPRTIERKAQNSAKHFGNLNSRQASLSGDGDFMEIMEIPLAEADAKLIKQRSHKEGYVRAIIRANTIQEPSKKHFLIDLDWLKGKTLDGVSKRLRYILELLAQEMRSMKRNKEINFHLSDKGEVLASLNQEELFRVFFDTQSLVKDALGTRTKLEDFILKLTLIIDKNLQINNDKEYLQGINIPVLISPESFTKLQTKKTNSEGLYVFANADKLAESQAQLKALSKQGFQVTQEC